MATENIVISLRECPGTPKLKRTVYKLKSTETTGYISSWLKKNLNMKPTEPLFLFIQPADSSVGFSPTPEQQIGDLSRAFVDGKKLTVFYSLKQVWG